MALFIHAENQTILWNIISNMEITKTVFIEGSPQKTIWFKNIIEEFYIKNYGKSLIVSDLRDLNREVIAYMVQNMRTMQMSSMNQKQPQKQVVYQEQQPVYSRNDQQMSMTSEQFGKRQQEYESMIKRPSPPAEVKFGDNIKDEPISNMEELLKQQQEQREYELNSIRPSVPQSDRETIKIHNQENITVKIDKELEETKSKKVSWSDELDLRAEIVSIKEQLAQLLTIVTELRNNNTIYQ